MNYLWLRTSATSLEPSGYLLLLYQYLQIFVKYPLRAKVAAFASVEYHCKGITIRSILDVEAVLDPPLIIMKEIFGKKLVTITLPWLKIVSFKIFFV